MAISNLQSGRVSIGWAIAEHAEPEKGFESSNLGIYEFGTTLWRLEMPYFGLISISYLGQKK